VSHVIISDLELSVENLSRRLHAASSNH
jgi:hypothetical protein